MSIGTMRPFGSTAAIWAHQRLELLNSRRITNRRAIHPPGGGVLPGVAQSWCCRRWSKGIAVSQISFFATLPAGCRHGASRSPLETPHGNMSLTPSRRTPITILSRPRLVRSSFISLTQPVISGSRSPTRTLNSPLHNRRQPLRGSKAKSLGPGNGLRSESRRWPPGLR